MVYAVVHTFSEVSRDCFSVQFVLLHPIYNILMKSKLYQDVGFVLPTRAFWAVFYLLFGINSDYAQPITGQVTEVTCPVIGRAQPKLTTP